MNNERKWMVTLDEGTYEWVKRTAGELNIHGSDIIKELIVRAKEQEKDSGFKESLLEARARLLRQELEKRREEIEAQLRDLSRHGVKPSAKVKR